MASTAAALKDRNLLAVIGDEVSSHLSSICATYAIGYRDRHPIGWHRSHGQQTEAEFPGG